MDILITLGVIILLVILFMIAFRIIGAIAQMVPDEERLVIYRLGRFNRIAGPGPVWVLPKVEDARSINVRDRPHELTISQVFAFGVSNELTLNLWCSFDLAKAAGDDKDKLSQLVQLSEAERRQQLEVKIREALVHQLSNLQRRRPLPETATTFDGVIALAPGSDRYNELLEGITQELAQTLRSIGVVLNTNQPITLVRRGIPEAIIDAIQRKYGREIDSEWLSKYFDLLRRDFPEIPGTVLAQVLSTIAGVDAGKLQRLFLESVGKDEREIKLVGDGSSITNVITKPRFRSIQETVLEFLDKAGFDFLRVDDQNAFIANPQEDHWRKRFNRGLYVRVLSNTALDHKVVQSIYQAAQGYTDHALVVISQQPRDNAWMTIGGLRADAQDRFVLLPISETMINKAIATNKAARTFNLYVRKHLGQDYNPYDVRDPVSDAISFFGREGILDEMLEEIRLGQRLGLFGLHKIGKSSVLQRLQQRSEFPVAYVYLRKNDNLRAIYERILDAWQVDIRIKYPSSLSWATPQLTTVSDPIGTFDTSAKDLLGELARMGNNSQLGVFLDEIEAIVPYNEEDESTLNLYLNLMDSLRGLQQETSSLSLLVAGVHPTLARVNYFWGDEKNPMHQVILERFLSPLDEVDCKVMIRSLGKQIRLSYDEKTVDYIFQMSGGHPFLARQICSLAYKQHSDIRTIPLNTVQQVAKDFVHNPATASYFDDRGLWGELGQESIWGSEVSRANHSILLALAASTSGLPESELYREAKKIATEQAIVALKERSVIRQIPNSDRYQISFGLFRDWIRLHKLNGA